jgi:hypothetical protein
MVHFLCLHLSSRISQHILTHGGRIKVACGVLQDLWRALVSGIICKTTPMALQRPTVSVQNMKPLACSSACRLQQGQQVPWRYAAL